MSEWNKISEKSIPKDKVVCADNPEWKEPVLWHAARDICINGKRPTHWREIDILERAPKEPEDSPLVKKIRTLIPSPNIVGDQVLDTISEHEAGIMAKMEAIRGTTIDCGQNACIYYCDTCVDACIAIVKGDDKK